MNGVKCSEALCVNKAKFIIELSHYKNKDVFVYNFRDIV